MRLPMSFKTLTLEKEVIHEASKKKTLKPTSVPT
jgi:hypothetical protein